MANLSNDILVEKSQVNIEQIIENEIEYCVMFDRI